MINDFKDKYKGETAVIIGNGPSLEKTPLDKLGAKYVTFGANKIYNYPFTPTFWACGDNSMLTDCIPWVVAHPEFNSEKFVPRHIPLPNAHQMTLEIAVGFSEDASVKMFMGGTISYINMQLAKHMGFTKLILVGMDHKYASTTKGGKPGSLFIAGNSDPDHFRGKDGEYFSPGKIYARPELEATERFFYPLANKHFESIINASVETALTVFKRDKAEKYV